MWRSLIRDFILYEFELGHNIVEATKNVCCAKTKGAVDRSTVTRWFNKFCSGWKNVDNQARLSRAKTVDSEAVLKAIEADPGISTRGISGKLSISQSIVVHHLSDISKSIQSYWIVPHVTKILQKFDSS